MRKTLFATFAAAAILFLESPTNQATAMPITSPSAIGFAASDSGTIQQVHYRRWHHRYGVWHRPYSGPYLAHPYACCDFPDGYGYPPGPYWGLGGYLNSWYM